MTVHQDDTRVLDLAAFNETRELIGDDRIANALTIFASHLARVLSAPNAAGDRADMLMLAHKLAPAAGSLGFVELSAASRALLDTRDSPGGAAEFDDAWVAMRKSAARTSAALENLRQPRVSGRLLIIRLAILRTTKVCLRRLDCIRCSRFETDCTRY